MRLTLTMGLGLIVSVPAAVPPCDEGLEPLPGSDLAYKPRGNRCEGLYTARLSGSLEIVSLTKGQLEFTSNPGTVLEVSVPGDVSSEIHVRGVALPRQTYYRMDARLSKSVPLTWPVREVLAPVGLDADSVGVFGWIEASGDRVYIPVAVSERSPLSPVKSTPIGPVLVLRSSVDIEKVSWRYSAGSGKARDWTPTKPPLLPGGPFRIELPTSANSDLLVEVRAKPRHRYDWFGLFLRVRLPHQNGTAQ